MNNGEIDHVHSKQCDKPSCFLQLIVDTLNIKSKVFQANFKGHNNSL